MKSKVGATIVTLLLFGALAVLVALLLNLDSLTAESGEIAPVATAPVTKGTIVDEVTGPAEIKGATNEKLKMARWRNFKAFVAPLNQRIAAGTPLVEYTNGQALTAPYDLVIRDKNLPEKKSEALTEEHFLEVSRTDLLHVEIEVHENDIARLAVGQDAQVKLSADESKVLTGKIVKINELGTYNATGSKYRVTIEVPNDGSVLIGMSANVNIVVGQATDALIVPVSAISDTSAGAFVTIMGEDGSVKSVPVETGLSDGKFVEVLKGLSEGDQVVTNESPEGPLMGSTAGTVQSFQYVG